MHAPKLALASNHERRSSVIEDQASVTSAVPSAVAETETPRLRKIMESFVGHMHDFAPEVRLTEEEFELGVVVACATQLGFSTGSTIVVDGGRAL
jgi:Catechol dioxygenase N terminus